MKVREKTDYVESETPDQNLLRGAKSIADKIDFGAILLNVKATDLEALSKILSANTFDNPTIKLSVYKNRRGRYKDWKTPAQVEFGACSHCESIQ